ncbi:MerR family transcriptional regulator [Amycolatopsis coloradensis]|uniref:MerR family transcriptional regulator n=1 Tax=Amycolatopsis coloradensis TaxID=76021 RepID=A0ACD5BP09_9PSEU
MILDSESRLPGSAEVARLLGISQVTLRTWEQRYGIGAGRREDNGRRRYTEEDIQRLRRMRALQAQGSSARDAARLVLTRSAAQATAGTRSARLVDAAEALDLAAVAGMLDDALVTLGVAATWTEIVAPVLSSLGANWTIHGERSVMTAEWALATAASAALDRYTTPEKASPGRRPVLLACGPAEGHDLPVKMLTAALRDHGAPALYLGGPVSVDVVRELTARFDPTDVVIWSIASHSADIALLKLLHDNGVPVRPAGPGWSGLPVVGEPAPASFLGALEAFGG